LHLSFDRNGRERGCHKRMHGARLCAPRDNALKGQQK
jgi:hypothetical protein